MNRIEELCADLIKEGRLSIEEACTIALAMNLLAQDNNDTLIGTKWINQARLMVEKTPVKGKVTV